MQVEVVVVRRGEDGVRRIERDEVIRIGEKTVTPPAAPVTPIRFLEPSSRPRVVATAVPSNLGVRRKKR